MAETTKLSVEKALDKLREPDAPKARIARLDEKTEMVDDEIRRLRARRLSLKRDQGRKA